MNSNFITEKTSISAIYSNPCLCGDWKQLAKLRAYGMGGNFKRLTTGIVLRLACKRTPKVNVIEGLNAIVDGKKQGLYRPLRIWRENEVQSNPLKRDVALYQLSCGKRAPFAIICPGGAYVNVASLIEGFPVAAELNRLGINAFVLSYGVKDGAHYPAPMEDLAKAVRYVLSNAQALNVTPENYAVFGFSAGGHMAACFGTEALGYRKYGLPRPGALVLGYPVITMGALSHRISRKTLLGNPPQTALVDRTSVENNVTDRYPRTYLWHCRSEKVVDVRNSLLLDAALTRHHVPHRLNLVDAGTHGWGLAKQTPAEGWLEDAVSFWLPGRSQQTG